MLHVTGRIKDIIIRGGENISAREIEEVLVEHPGIAKVAIVGYPDPRLGERCCAVVVPVAGQAISLDAVNAFLNEHGVARYKLPERLEIVDDLPTTTTGKVRKSELRQQLAASIP
jgi:cyclohexanecarboxylate-CoA ligase